MAKRKHEDHISDEVLCILDSFERGHIGSIGLERYKELRLNSYEREALLPVLSAEALKYVIQNTLKHVAPLHRNVASTYDEFALHNLLPELVRRFMPEPKSSGKCRARTDLYEQTPGCDGDIISASGGGVKCTKCRAWFCW